MESKRQKSIPFSLLIKPAGADCNLHCAYCFYLQKGRLYPDSKIHRMSEAVLERLIASYMATEQPVYAFGWQGGEPTLMGLDFFRKAVQFQLQYGKPGASVSNGLQTNGTLLTDAMAAFFTEYRFLLGVSLDGPPEIHDRFRSKIDGAGSHREVMRGIRALRRQKTEFNALTLVTQANIRQGKEVYRYLKEEGFFFHQYIPCVEYDASGKPLPWTISGEEWGRFLLSIFEAWYSGDARAISIRQFDSVLEALLAGKASVCTMADSCRQYFVVEHNGDVYPCDFFVDPGWKLGNLMENADWPLYTEAPLYKRFAGRKGALSQLCAECPYLSLCQGDCPKHRIPYLQQPPETRHVPPPRHDTSSLSGAAEGHGIGLFTSVLCEGWKLFYRETLPEFQKLARNLKA